MGSVHNACANPILRGLLLSFTPSLLPRSISRFPSLDLELDAVPLSGHRMRQYGSSTIFEYESAWDLLPTDFKVPPVIYLSRHTPPGQNCFKPTSPSCLQLLSVRNIVSTKHVLKKHVEYANLSGVANSNRESLSNSTDCIFFITYMHDSPMSVLS